MDGKEGSLNETLPFCELDIHPDGTQPMAPCHLSRSLKDSTAWFSGKEGRILTMIWTFNSTFYNNHNNLKLSLSLKDNKRMLRREESWVKSWLAVTRLPEAAGSRRE